MTESFLKNSSQSNSPEKGPSRVVSRLAGPEDWEALKKIRLAAITGPDSEMFGPLGVARDINKTDEEWRAELAPGNQHLFYMLAFDGSEVSGMVRTNFLETTQAWFITGAYTTRDSRGKIFARKVLLDINNEVRRRGGEEVFIAVKRGNERALRLYKAMGFKEASKGISDKIKDPVSNFKWVTLKMDVEKNTQSVE